MSRFQSKVKFVPNLRNKLYSMDKGGYSKLTVAAVMIVMMVRNEAARVVGGDGVIFHFNGQKDQDYCLLTDSKIHVNAQMIGLSKNER